MILTIVFLVAVANFAYEAKKYRDIHGDGPDSLPPLDVILHFGESWVAELRRTAPSDDPAVEHQRRVTLAALVLVVPVGVVWVLSPAQLDDIVAGWAALTPMAGGAPIVALVVAVVGIRLLIDATVGPHRNLWFALAACAGILFSTILLGLTPGSAG